jgi:hypothetical protein
MDFEIHYCSLADFLQFPTECVNTYKELHVADVWQFLVATNFTLHPEKELSAFYICVLILSLGLSSFITCTHSSSSPRVV